MWSTLKTWIQSGNGIMATAAAGVALVACGLKCWRAISIALTRTATVIRFFANIDRHHDAIAQRLNAIDRGQIHMISTRRVLLDRETASAFFECDPQGKCIWVSRFWRKLTGMDLEDAKGNGWELGVAEDCRERVSELWSEAIAKRRPFEATVVYADKDGNRSTMRVTANPIQEDSGEILGYFGHCSK